jgi:YidC/Oxa1 family membrane protein insertase
MSIVLLTLAVRLLISPLTYFRMRTEHPIRGLLLSLAQAPFFLVMYRFAMSHQAGSLFGVPLAAHLVGGWPVFAVLLALAVLLAWWSSHRIESKIAAWLPYLSVAAVAYLPLAGALYLVTSSAWTALETAVWRRKQSFLNG